VKLQLLAATSDRVPVAEPPHAQQDATLRTMALGTLILNAFSVRAVPGRFIRCRCSAIQNNVQTDTYDPRRPGATPSLLSYLAVLIGRGLRLVNPDNKHAALGR
jgi:hypothetical protein